MVDYTQPVEAMFEMQRKSLEQGQHALKQGVEMQSQFGKAAVESMGSQESFQRSAVELQQDLVHSFLDGVEANVPGMDEPVLELREMVDEQYAALLESHEELFTNLTGEMEEGVDAADQMSEEYVGMLDDQMEMLYETHEELEGQSVEAVEEMQAQFEEVSEQAEELQAQVQEVSEQAAESVEA